MSFVAEPYAEVVDNLLTALTGGVVYEDQIFNPKVMTYSLAHPPADVNTIKISGSLNREFHVFVPDQDFEISPGEIAWLEDEGANQPDEGTRFYINYYPSVGYLQPLLTDRNTGSVTSLLAESFAREFALLSKRLHQVYLAGFVDTAENRSLDQVVAILGIERKTAQYAVGNVVFSRETPSPADIFIPEGFLVSTEEPVGEEELPAAFETTAQRLLRKNQLSITVPVRAVNKGETGLVETNKITLMNRPLLGIDKLTNPDQTTFGTEPETDEQLRQRAKSQLERAGKTTLKALKYALLAIRAQSGDKISQLKETDIKIEEDFSQGPGLVRILLDADDSNPNLVREVNRAVFETRAAGIAVVHNLNQPGTGENPGPGTDTGVDEATEAALAVRAALDEAGIEEPDTTGEEMEKPIVDLKKIEVTLSLTISFVEISLKEPEKEAIASTVREDVTAYFESLPIGKKVVMNQVIAAVMNVEGVADIVRLQWTAKQPTGESNNGTRFDIHVPSNQKAVLSGGADAVDIKFAGSPVRVDFFIDATINGDSDLTRGKLEKEIQLKLAAYFDTQTGNLNLPQLERALAGNEYTVSSMAVNVEYAESGLIIRNAQDQGDEVGVKDNEIAVVGMVRINVTGGVEGA